MYVHVCSGFTSRCTTLAHAYYLMKTGGGKCLYIIWPITYDCNISFYDAFSKDIFKDIRYKVIEIKLAKAEMFLENSGGIKQAIFSRKFFGAAKIFFVKSIYWLNVRARDTFYKKGKRCYEYFPPEHIGWGGQSHRKYVDSVWEQLKVDMESDLKGDIFIHAYCGIIRDERVEEIDYGKIIFKKDYWDEVKKILRRENRYVGVHIRRTDHKRAIEKSGSDLFVEKIKEILSADTQICFFLATDDKSEEKRLREIFGDKIVTQTGK